MIEEDFKDGLSAYMRIDIDREQVIMWDAEGVTTRD